MYAVLTQYLGIELSVCPGGPFLPLGVIFYASRCLFSVGTGTRIWGPESIFWALGVNFWPLGVKFDNWKLTLCL